MCIRDSILKLLCIFTVKDLLENVLKGMVILFGNGILGGKPKILLGIKGIVKAASGKAFNGLVNICLLYTSNIHFTHVDLALQSEKRGGGSQGHPVLSGSCFRDQALLSHELCQKSLAHTVIQLVGPGVV